MVNLLFDEFINGHKRSLSEEEKKLFNNVLTNTSGYYPFLQKSSQLCNNLFISINFREKNITSNRIPDGSYEELVPLGASHFSTDFGSCCSFTPHLHLKPFDSNSSLEEVYHGLKADALNGETRSDRSPVWRTRSEMDSSYQVSSTFV